MGIAAEQQPTIFAHKRILPAAFVFLTTDVLLIGLSGNPSGKQQRVGCFFRWVGNRGWSPREPFPIRSFPGPGLPENGFTDLMPIFPISDANVCNPSRKRLQPRSQTFASKTPKNALSGPPRQKCQDDTIRKPSSACRAVAIT